MSPATTPVPTMRCPACKVENENGVTHCTGCQAALPARKKSRRRADAAADAPPSPRAEALLNQARAAYKMCLVGLVPFLGLALGPLSALTAYRVQQSARTEPTYTEYALPRLCVRLGTAITLANWVGLGLILLGMYQMQ